MRAERSVCVELYIWRSHLWQADDVVGALGGCSCVRAQVGGFFLVHKQDLAAYAPLWLSITGDVRNDSDVSARVPPRLACWVQLAAQRSKARLFACPCTSLRERKGPRGGRAQAWRLSGDQYVEKGGRPWISEMYGYVYSGAQHGCSSGDRPSTHPSPARLKRVCVLCAVAAAAKKNIWHKWDRTTMHYPTYFPVGESCSLQLA